MSELYARTTYQVNNTQNHQASDYRITSYHKLKLCCNLSRSTAASTKSYVHPFTTSIPSHPFSVTHNIQNISPCSSKLKSPSKKHGVHRNPSSRFVLLKPILLPWQKLLDVYIAVEKPTVNVDSATKSDDPFAAQRNGVQNGEKAASPTAGSPVADRRLSADEWGK